MWFNMYGIFWAQVESSIEVVKSDDAAEAIIDAADRFFATKLVLSASDNPSP